MREFRHISEKNYTMYCKTQQRTKKTTPSRPTIQRPPSYLNPIRAKLKKTHHIARKDAVASNQTASRRNEPPRISASLANSPQGTPQNTAHTQLPHYHPANESCIRHCCARGRGSPIGPQNMEKSPREESRGIRNEMQAQPGMANRKNNKFDLFPIPSTHETKVLQGGRTRNATNDESQNSQTQKNQIH